jgi:hypothetical protein
MPRPIALALAVTLLALASTDTGRARQGADESDLVGVEENAYQSPTWGYSLRWDDTLWLPVQASSADGVDALFLQSRQSILFLQGVPFAGDPAACLATTVDALSREDGVDDWEPLEDEDGDPIAGETDGRAWAAFTLTFTTAGGDEFADADYVECRRLVAGEAVLLILHNTRQDAYPEEAEAVEAVLATLDLPEAEGGDEEGRGSEGRHGWEVETAASGRTPAGTSRSAAVDCDAFAGWLPDTADRVRRAYQILEEIGTSSVQSSPEDFVLAMKDHAAEFEDLAEAQLDSDPPADVAEANQELATTFENYATVVGEIAGLLEYAQVALPEGVAIDNALLAEMWDLLPRLTDYLVQIVDHLSGLADGCGIEV